MVENFIRKKNFWKIVILFLDEVYWKNYLFFLEMIICE